MHAEKGVVDLYGGAGEEEGRIKKNIAVHSEAIPSKLVGIIKCYLDRVS